MPLTAFQNVFAGNPLDRSSYQRSNPEWIAGKLADPGSIAMVLWNGKPMVESRKDAPKSSQIAYVRAELAGELGGDGERLLFMGLWQETAVFALDMEGPADPADGPLEGLGRFEDLRMIALELPPADAAMFATAKAMFEWRRRHRHCANCGQPTEPMDGGWKRFCPSCKVEHFPRTDPVVIMTVEHDGRLLLGRRTGWPEGRLSVLAGFVSPGESAEEAVVREVREESGIIARDPVFVASQPWPFPASLMFGFHAEADGGEPRNMDGELEEVHWLDLEKVRRAVEDEDEAGFALPGRVSIARFLIERWVAGKSS